MKETIWAIKEDDEAINRVARQQNAETGNSMLSGKYHSRDKSV